MYTRVITDYINNSYKFVGITKIVLCIWQNAGSNWHQSYGTYSVRRVPEGGVSGEVVSYV